MSASRNGDELNTCKNIAVDKLNTSVLEQIDESI